MLLTEGEYEIPTPLSEVRQAIASLLTTSKRGPIFKYITLAGVRQAQKRESVLCILASCSRHCASNITRHIYIIDAHQTYNCCALT